MANQGRGIRRGDATSKTKARLQPDTSVNGVLTLNPAVAVAACDAIADGGSRAKLGTFDLATWVLTRTRAGNWIFAAGGDDQPTSALGVKQAGVVLRYIAQARDRGPEVVFITHNPHRAYPIGDRFLLLNRGVSLGEYGKADITSEELTALMAGGAELEQLAHELSRGDPAG